MEVSSCLVLCCLLLPLLYFLCPKSKIQHGLKVYPVVGTLPLLIKNRDRILEWLSDVLERSPTHSISVKVLGRPGAIFTANPANLEHILKAKFGNYPKGEELTDIVHDFLGDGIFNSDGEEWQQQRKVASYEFSTRSLRNFVVHAVRFEVVERLLPLLERLGDGEDDDTVVVDVQDMLERFALDNICRVAFDQDPACLTEESMGASHRSLELMHAFEAATNTIVFRFMSPAWLWRLMRRLNVGPERQMRRALTSIHGYADQIIRDRRHRRGMSETNKDDLLSRFAESGEHSDETLRYVITNFILAGRDSTSAALTWLFWLVSTRPDVEAKIYNEIRAVRDSAATAAAPPRGAFSFEELRDMHYTHAAITESMRLYPPVPLNAHTCTHDDVLPDGTFVGKGWRVTYSAHAMGRVHDVWGKDAAEFRPDRWLDDTGAFRPETPCKYPVFHAGPRMCLGKDMAYIQMKSIVACVYESFSLRYVGKDQPALHLSGTLRMAGGLPMHVKRRTTT